MTQPIIRQHTRILIPKEYQKFRTELNAIYKVIADVLLQTGMRVEEFWEFLEHPGWYRAARRCIDLPKGSIKKVKALHTERTVLLTLEGCDAVETLLALKPDHVTRTSMRDAFRRAAGKSIGVEGISPKMFRKSLISWLVAVYPEKHLYIAASAGHSQEIMRVHYLGIAFERGDIEDMRLFLKGWGEA